ncbi:uncharacterized protein K452DRAFT_223107 [Aplosporella prunicola CBS 121167]|uniref:MARVEL domain-containing protein n=1 Tax=Aplosporella prunicola CBS 121167 TaxID=1176127 RepID=A0A6A6BK30_9PEZI|nr:uncharacterized protein K452DRAFT_223107 [Aplosporella prunicola CBS 121167]KAF2144469.1 hypothetical protein K452DRAFT_223107 [Aplosporella prunicola CBS 121167]
MARSVVGRAVVVREKYYWPDIQLNIWTILMLATAGTILGIFAEFMQIHSAFKVGSPWLFPYGVTVGALTIVFIIIEIILIAQRRLLPGVMMLGAFILLVLYLAGIIETGIQLFGSSSNVNGNCQRWVTNNKVTGPSVETLAWLQQNNICSCWNAAFAFWIIGACLFIWMIIMGSQVNQNQFD